MQFVSVTPRAPVLGVLTAGADWLPNPGPKIYSAFEPDYRDWVILLYYKSGRVHLYVDKYTPYAVVECEI